MKKLLSLALALMLALSCVGVVARPAHAENASALPKVGDVTNGFEVKEIQPFALVGADLVLFEHQRTGAKLLWIANADTNRLFQLTFPTRPNNDMGLPHVFEHATLFGSDKYPSTSLFFNISYQTYNTYVNAYTTDACTSYPLASLSEKQLLNLADYYVDSCFHPLIMSDEGIFRTQAWHYDLNSLDGELTYEGVVYSEMQGAMTLERTALEYANDLTFPGAALSYSYGGLPENIPEMTWEDVKAYHDKYYHPSNCLAILYGQFDEYEAFLKLLDEAFAPYEKVEFTFEDAGYKPIEKAQVASFGYPMAEGTDVTNQTVIIYYILCPGMKGDVEQENLIDNVSSLLNQNGSVLSQSFKRAFPSGNLSCGREVAGPDDAIIFQATGMNRDDAEKFKALVDEALLDVANNGFPQDMVDSAMTSLNISAKLAPENGDPAEGVVYSFAYDYAVTGDPFAFVNQMASLSRIDEENQKGLLKEAVAKWLTNNELYTLTTTYPAPGEKEKVDAALKEELAKIKAGMSQEQLQAIVDETNAAPKEEDTSELMAKIKAITVENLPEEVKAYTVNDFTDDKGIRHIEAVAGVDGIGHVSLELDAAALPQEDIHWMRLYTRLLGKLDTDKHTKEELDVLIDRYMYDKVTGVDCVDLKDSIHPYLVGEWYALDDDLATGYDLMEELLFHTRFDDVQKLLEQVQAQKTSVRATINNNAYSVMLYRGLADKSPFYLYYSYLNFLEYYAFLENLEAMLGEKPQEVTKHFEELQSFFANSAGAVAAFAGNEKSIELNRPLADAFLAKLKHEDREPVAYGQRPVQQRDRHGRRHGSRRLRRGAGGGRLPGQRQDPGAHPAGSDGRVYPLERRHGQRRHVSGQLSRSQPEGHLRRVRLPGRPHRTAGGGSGHPGWVHHELLFQPCQAQGRIDRGHRRHRGHAGGQEAGQESGIHAPDQEGHAGGGENQCRALSEGLGERRPFHGRQCRGHQSEHRSVRFHPEPLQRSGFLQGGVHRCGGGQRALRCRALRVREISDDAQGAGRLRHR